MKHLVCILGLSGALTLAAQSQPPPPAFQIEETTIAQIHAAMRAGRLTCRDLVEQYLKRIEAYDKTGPAINAIVVVNPDAMAQADAMDRRARQGTQRSDPTASAASFSDPLFCIPGADEPKRRRPAEPAGRHRGPMTRTLEDVVIVLQVIAGPDQDDPVTVPGTPIARDFSPSGRPANFPNFVASLKKDGLKGRRIGVLRQAYESATTDPEIVKVFMAAVEGRLHLTATKVVDSSRYWSY